ncbi:unnamed protein product [Arctia plantaginis]|uniref:CRAL-TRIO domain-containing protein n=1 Tax=Arctia plantaginis TaxID=874455 RepID=A0A8S0YSC3_ARCPL|nr:unnamed protein product [Arctia plantaginis]
MEAWPTSHLLELPPNGVQEIRKLYNFDSPDRIKQAVDVLEDWLKKQDHILKKDFSRGYLEKTIISCKGSVEKAKRRIDRLCTYKTLLPQFFLKTNWRTECKEVLDIALIAVLPKVTKDYYRVSVIKFHDKAMMEKHCLQYFQYNFILIEYVKAHDYVNGFIMILDFEEINILDMVTAINPVVLQQFMSILIEGFGARLKAIYVLTQSKLVDLFINITKKFLSEKISKRVNVIKTIEELYTTIPKEILPEEYGGQERSYKQISADWIEELSTKQHQDYIKMMYEACTDETLRRPDQFNDDLMGIPGSFRNMIVD